MLWWVAFELEAAVTYLAFHEPYVDGRACLACSLVLLWESHGVEICELGIFDQPGVTGNQKGVVFDTIRAASNT